MLNYEICETKFLVSNVFMTFGVFTIRLWDSLKDNLQNCNCENLIVEYNR